MAIIPLTFSDDFFIDPDSPDQSNDIGARTGNDYVDGRLGNDTIHGGQGNDRILGGGGEDKLYGDLDRDTISGGSGNDEIWGDRDLTTPVNQGIYSGRTKTRSSDVFEFESDATLNGVDRIMDLDVLTQGGVDIYGRSGSEATYDRLDLSNLFGRKELPDTAKPSNYIQIVKVGQQTELRIDKDGQGGAGPEIYAYLNKFKLSPGLQAGTSSQLEVGDQVFVFAKDAYSGFLAVTTLV